jgi:hypothetical protein
MQSTLTGLVIIGISVLIAASSRNNTDETAAQTFGTLGLILVLALIGLSFVRRGEAERVRNKRKAPFKPAFQPPKGAVGGPGGPLFPAPKPSFEIPEEARKAIVGLLLLTMLVAAAVGLKVYFFPSALSQLAQVESPRSSDEGEKKLDPILEKMAQRFGQDRGDIDDAFWTVWQANQKALVEYGLKPSSFAREVLAAAPKNAEMSAVANSIAQEKPAARLARLHQLKPAPGKYPQEVEFQKALDQLHKKTALNAKPLTAALVNRWRVVFEKKKNDRKYNLLWFVKLVNAETKKPMKRENWLTRLAKTGL